MLHSLSPHHCHLLFKFAPYAILGGCVADSRTTKVQDMPCNWRITLCRDCFEKPLLYGFPKNRTGVDFLYYKAQSRFHIDYVLTFCTKKLSLDSTLTTCSIQNSNESHRRPFLMVVEDMLHSSREIIYALWYKSMTNLGLSII